MGKDDGFRDAIKKVALVKYIQVPLKELALKI